MVDTPPWRLHARGHAVLFAPNSSSRQIVLDPRVRSLGGFGLLLLLEYDRSDVGPYNEALYVPGRISIRLSGSAHADRPTKAPKTRRGHSISWIVVTTRRSRDGGIANWGIPKTLGSVLRRALPSGGERYLVLADAGQRLLRIDVPRDSRPVFPLRLLSLAFNARVLPHTLVQSTPSAVYETRIGASGRVCAAGRARITGYTDQTKGIASRRVLATLRIQRVRLWFPPAVKY